MLVGLWQTIRQEPNPDLTAAYLATLVDWSEYLSDGEPGVIQIVAGDRAQAQVIFRFLTSFLKGAKALKPLIGRQTAEIIELKNGITIEIATASFKTIRGRTVVAVLCSTKSLSGRVKVQTPMSRLWRRSDHRC